MRRGQIKMQTVVSLIFITAALLLLTLLSSLNALDIEGAKERPCIEIKKTAPMDLSWVMSQKTWYYPLMSRLDVYLTASAMIDKDVKDLTEDELYYDSCLKFNIEGGNFAGYGFNGIKKTFSIKPIKGMEVYEAYYADGSTFGTCYTTLTDNKTFIFTSCCTELEQQTWGVITPLKKLPKDILNLNEEHAKSLGFKKEFFTGLRYDHCEDDEDKQENKTEL